MQYSAHFNNLLRMHEELSRMSATPHPKEFLTIMLRSLPHLYGPLLNAITIAASMGNAQLDPDNIATLVIQEYDRHTIEERQLKSSESALVVKSRGKQQHQAKTSNSANSSSEVECWKCRELGHVRAKCPKNSKKGKKDKGNKKKDESANATSEADEGEAFAFTSTFAGATLMWDDSPLAGLEVEVYDLGVSCHMSPYHHLFMTFKEIPPCPINATDKMTFHATGIGNMQVSIPNGNKTTHITLKDVWYCEKLAFTLVSIML